MGDGSMAYIAGALALGWGVFLAALDAPSVSGKPSVQRLGTVLVAASTALATAGLVYGIGQYVAA